MSQHVIDEDDDFYPPSGRTAPLPRPRTDTGTNDQREIGYVMEYDEYYEDEDEEEGEEGDEDAWDEDDAAVVEDDEAALARLEETLEQVWGGMAAGRQRPSAAMGYAADYPVDVWEMQQFYGEALMMQEAINQQLSVQLHRKQQLRRQVANLLRQTEEEEVARLGEESTRQLSLTLATVEALHKREKERRIEDKLQTLARQNARLRDMLENGPPSMMLRGHAGAAGVGGPGAPHYNTYYPPPPQGGMPYAQLPDRAGGVSAGMDDQAAPGGAGGVRGMSKTRSTYALQEELEKFKQHAEFESSDSSEAELGDDAGGAGAGAAGASSARNDALLENLGKGEDAHKEFLRRLAAAELVRPTGKSRFRACVLGAIFPIRCRKRVIWRAMLKKHTQTKGFREVFGLYQDLCFKWIKPALANPIGSILKDARMSLDLVAAKKGLFSSSTLSKKDMAERVLKLKVRVIAILSQLLYAVSNDDASSEGVGSAAGGGDINGSAASRAHAHAHAGIVGIMSRQKQQKIPPSLLSFVPRYLTDDGIFFPEEEVHPVTGDVKPGYLLPSEMTNLEFDRFGATSGMTPSRQMMMIINFFLTRTLLTAILRPWEAHIGKADNRPRGQPLKNLRILATVVYWCIDSAFREIPGVRGRSLRGQGDIEITSQLLPEAEWPVYRKATKAIVNEGKELVLHWAEEMYERVMLFSRSKRSPR